MLYNKYIDHTLLKPDATEEQIRSKRDNKKVHVLHL